MNSRVIYFDNAATTFPKPESVYKANDDYARRAGNPGRGAHRLALESARLIFDTRVAVSEMLGIKSAERLIFTPSCTYSINMALKGMQWEQGDAVLVSSMEHNAVMRPLRQLERERGLRVVMVPYAKKGIIDLHAFIKAMLEAKPRLCVFSEASNVTGEVIDMKSVAAICGAHKVPLMVDAAQMAGRTVTAIEEQGISLWCSSGHKGLYGLPGVGLLYVSPNIELQPLVCGGTGSRSDEFDMPEDYPDHLEPGTLPGPAIAALGAGVRWLKDTGIEKIVDVEQKLTKRFLDWVQKTGAVRVFGNRFEASGTSTVAFDIPGMPCDRVAAVLDSQYGIAVRTGLHCAPTAHYALGTLQQGLVRVSFSYFNTEQEVDSLCQALQALASLRDSQTPVRIGDVEI